MSTELRYKKIELESIEGARLLVVDHNVAYEFGQCAQSTGLTFEVISSQSCKVGNKDIVVADGFVLLRLFKDEKYQGRGLLDFNTEFKLVKRIESGSVIEY